MEAFAAIPGPCLGEDYQWRYDYQQSRPGKLVFLDGKRGLYYAIQRILAEALLALRLIETLHELSSCEEFFRLHSHSASVVATRLRQFRQSDGSHGIFVRLPWRRRRGRGPRAAYSVLLGHHRFAKCRWLGAGCVRVAVRVVLRGEPCCKIEHARRVVRNADGCHGRHHHRAGRDDRGVGDWLYPADSFPGHPPARRRAMGYGLALAPQPNHAGGERQRLCLARAMLRRPHLLVLDEATSAIDIGGEHALFERLLLATPRPTIVMIAHRLESLRHCQRILLFEGGTMVSDGAGGVLVARERQKLRGLVLGTPRSQLPVV
jgi:hypothetical protein